MTDRVLKLSINEHLIDKCPPKEHRHFAHGFKPVKVTIEGLEECVSRGYCFSYQYKNQHRKTDNFIRSDFLAVDMDGGRKIQDCLSDSIVKKHGSLFYTTHRHNSDRHRFRLVFALPRTLTNVDELKSATRALSRRLGGDMKATDGARMFYGSTECWSKLLGGSISDDFLNKLIIEGNDNPVSDSVRNRWTTSISDIPLDPHTQIFRADGTEVSLMDIQEKTHVFCCFHHDERPQATVSKSFKYGTRYLVCQKCKMLWWEKNARFSKIDFDDFEKTIRKIKSDGFRKNDGPVTPIEDFIGANPVSPENIHITNDMFLNINELKRGLTLIKSPKGTGKTFFLEGAVKEAIEIFATVEDFEEASALDPNVRTLTEDKILLVGHRQALIGSLCERLGLNSYLDDKNNNSHSDLYNQNHYGICLDSLGKLASTNYDVVIIDEVEQVLGHFLSDTIGAKRENIFHVFSSLIKNAKKIVVLDADLGWITYNTLHSLISDSTDEYSFRNNVAQSRKKPLPIHVYINDWKQEGRELNVFPSDVQLIQHIKSSILEGKRIFISSNSKKKIKILEKAVNKLADESTMEIPVIAITSDNSATKKIQRFIQNIKKDILNYKVILSSPSLGTGIDITFENSSEEIHCVYGLFENRVNSHFEIDQQLARVRHPKEVNVWISNSRYNFATDIEVVSEDSLKWDLVSGVRSGLISQSNFEESGIPPFLKMAAQIVATQRASKNNLKYNFIEYKKSQKWKINIIPKDGALSGEGEALYKSMRDLTVQEEIENIARAKTLNRFQYGRIKEKLDNYGQSIELEERFSFIKTNLELFYGLPADEGIVGLDEKGKYRGKVKRFESIIRNPHLSEEETKNENDKRTENLNRISMELVKKYNHGSRFLRELLSLTPIFKNGKFDPSVVFSTHNLMEFGEKSEQYRKFVQTQLDVSTRTDVTRKPMQHLGKILEIVGLDTKKIAENRRNRKKTYYYKLSTPELDVMLDITNRRDFYNLKSTNTGWAYVNKLHRFQYSEKYEDWHVRRQ